MAGMEAFERALTAWREINLASRREEWDITAKSLADARETTKQERGALAGRSKAFTLLTDEAEKAVHLGPLMKSYQQMINSLVERQRVASAAFVDAYSTLSCAPDPYPILDFARTAMHADSARSAATLREENSKLRARVAEYEVEFLSLTNQDAKIAALQERLATYNAKIDEVVAAAVERKLGEAMTAEAVDVERLRHREASLLEEITRAASIARDSERQSASSDALSQRLADEVAALHRALEGQQSAHAVEVDALNARVGELRAECARLQRSAALAAAVAGASGGADDDEGEGRGREGRGGSSPTLPAGTSSSAGGGTGTTATSVGITNSPYVERLCAQLRLADHTTAKLEAQLAAAQGELESQTSRVTALTRALSAAPNARAHERLVQRVKVLEAAGRSLLGADLDVPSETDGDKAGGSGGGGGGDGGGAALRADGGRDVRTHKAVADALKGRVRVLEQQLLESTRGQQEAARARDEASGRLNEVAAECERLRQLVASLEDDVAQLAGATTRGATAGATSPGGGGGAVGGFGLSAPLGAAPLPLPSTDTVAAAGSAAGAASAVPDSAGMNRSLAALAAQRDRFKQQAQSAEQRAVTAERRAAAAEDEVVRLRASHTVQLGGGRSFGGDGGGGSWGGGATRRKGADDADRYANELHAQAEVESVRRGVNAAERYAMRTTTALLTHRKARLIVFGYLLLVHLLMFAVLHRLSVHRCHPTVRIGP